MPLPKVSVCIDVYNYADFVSHAIESTLEQTWTDFELIVVDDCSTDASFEVAQAYARQDARIRAARNPANLGMIGNRNACLRMARGEYVKFIHADDFLCSPDALRRMVTRLDSNPAASLVACAMRHVDAHACPTGAARPPYPGDVWLAGTTAITHCLYTQKNLIGPPSAVLFRRSRAERGFDARRFHAADLEMWFHLLEQGCFGYISEPLAAYRWHARQQTEKDRGTLSQANDQRAILAEYLNKPYVRLKPWLKEYLAHDAVRQTLRRSAKIKQRDQGAEALQAYGRGRYYRNLPWCFAWRKAGKRLPFLQTALPPAIHTRAESKKTESDKPESKPAESGRAEDAAPASHKLAGREAAYPMGVNVAGFFKGQYGLGESSRAFCRAVTASGLPSVMVNIHSPNHSNRDDSVAQLSERNPYGVNLMAFSFDYARRFYRERGSRYFEGRANVALWYWEQEQFPARWHSNFDYYDEIWVPTEFCRQAFAAVSPIPVRKLTYPLEIERDAEADETVAAAIRAEFGLRAGDCVFLFSFDFCSTIARKNPLGVLAAFRQAFAPAEDAALVLKSINSHFDAEAHRQVQQAVGTLRREGRQVAWIEPHLSGAQMKSLFRMADCYASLHRSEGLGLGLAQAMAMGKPVIATGYSGNLEYMNASNSLLVGYERVALTADHGPYERGSFWAEPDVGLAAEHMRRMYERPEERAQLGERARRAIRELLNPAITQAEIRARVQELCDARKR